MGGGAKGERKSVKSGKVKPGALGSGLMRRVAGGVGRGGGQVGQYAHMYTTDLGDGRAAQMQSVLDVDDLEDMMEMADLAGRSFAAERQNVVVLSTCAPPLTRALPQPPRDARTRA